MNNKIVGAVDVKYLDMLPKPVLNDEFFIQWTLLSSIWDVINRRGMNTP